MSSRDLYIWLNPACSRDSTFPRIGLSTSKISVFPVFFEATWRSSSKRFPVTAPTHIAPWSPGVHRHQQQQQQRVPAVQQPQPQHQLARQSPRTGVIYPYRNSNISSNNNLGTVLFNSVNNNNNSNSSSNNNNNNKNNSNSNSLLLHTSSNMGSAGISSAVLGHAPSPYQTNADQMNAYTGQYFTRPQNFHGSFQQNMCNGYGNANSAGGGGNGATQTSRNGPRSSGVSTRRNSAGSPAAALSSTNVYIRGLDQNTTDDDLRRMCAKYGRIASTKAIMDKNTGQCKRYGFVDFEKSSDAQRAVEGLNQEGKVQAQMAKALSPNNQNSVFQQQEQDPTNLYLANLPPDYTEKDLQKLLENYGATISTRVLKNVDGSSRCVGFARMDNEDLCAKIIREMNGKKVFPGYNLPLMVKYADSNKKLKNRPLQSVSGLYNSLTHPDITDILQQPCYATPPYEQTGPYIRSNPNFQYLLPTASPYAYTPHPQYHVFSGYGDAPAAMGNLAAQMQNLSLHGAASAMLQPSGDLTNIVPGTSMTANQAPTATAIPPVAMQTYATLPVYPWPYGVQDPNLMGTVVSSAAAAAALQSYGVPELTAAAIHPDAANAAAVAAANAAAVAAAAAVGSGGVVPQATAVNHPGGQIVYTTQPPPPQPPPQVAAAAVAAAAPAAGPMQQQQN